MWEYYTYIMKSKKAFLGAKYDENEVSDKLNLLGKEGWELVNTTALNVFMGESDKLLFVFKRKIS